MEFFFIYTYSGWNSNSTVNCFYKTVLDHYFNFPYHMVNLLCNVSSTTNIIVNWFVINNDHPQLHKKNTLFISFFKILRIYLLIIKNIISNEILKTSGRLKLNGQDIELDVEFFVFVFVRLKYEN